MKILDGVYKVIEVIYDEAEKEWLDEEKYKHILSDLYEKLENDEISEEEYEEQENDILERLKEIREYKKENNS
ncbi:gas vesicle protein GvpG [Clostridium sp. ZS2-4]|uniref:gas vesicle protein GvpG n=1 Tax=Clostridium sp. ZS2-4 TaxID=2987703 RepID=UPI00227D4B37|nr:gas vesicle protein GvpG [Clostridium sp. ZS2-4]MCY6354428.1 gas vesicle protein GvpG [Clostridium sp. ZS2-4]